MSKTTVLYHKADFDGIFCREIARKFLPEADLIGWDYGDEVPKVPLDRQVYMLDISVDGMMNYPQLIWIDHHKSAIEKFRASIPGYRIDGVAACRLAWQWFKWPEEQRVCAGALPPLPEKQEYIDRNVSEPLAVRLAGEYDIWDKRDPDAELFQHGLRSQDLSDNMWELLLADPQKKSWDGKHGVGELAVEALLDAGKAIQYAKTKENESIIKDLGFTFQWEGLTWLACNHARYNSHLFTAALRPEHDACFGFKFTGHIAGGKPCEEWSISLYHAPGKEHHDLSVIAAKYGGGGHRGACGFRTNKLPFLT